MKIREIGTIFVCWLSVMTGMAQNLAGRLGQFLDESPLLETSEVGVMVYDLTSDSLVFAHQADKLYRPASTEKVITAVTALATLGTDYPFVTQVAYTGEVKDSILKGDVYVIGAFDPVFMEKDLERFSDTLAGKGIRRIEGKLIGDVSLMDSVYWGPGWSWDDTPYSFQPYLSPLMLNRGCVEVTVQPAAKGLQGTVEVSPSSDYYQVENRSVSRTPSAGKLVITRDWLEQGNRIQVAGCISAKRTKTLNLYDSKAFFLETFRYQLANRGIQVDSVGYGECPIGAKELVRCTHPLTDVLKVTLKKSDNLAAEALFYHVGKHGTDKGGSLGNLDGQVAIRKYMKELVGMDPDRYSIADGSGVSLYNYISPHLLLSYLNYAYRHPVIFQPFYDCLPIAGIDGTLANRMKKGKTYRNVRAKTGTVTGVSSLAGYVKAGNGHWLSFVIINQNVLKGRQARLFQDELCEILAN
ncbi:D-alanyl-D-alanine carboxypeptidase/D-alanyl-D-alanine-endopeptidase [Phocaeicola barnesiae]|nr:D-alanyl-D-alanine carboxypeptidase/D-alanyl-D-alanine-endopeptidase [Phocaeicola barnesiae]MCF2576394.1 D-alanyl-D-alanine carboxypeptidase/D-alanyl-D-alanine-endopeptidase [Phocaeicola barnesiae]